MFTSTLYTAHATAVGGPCSHAETRDGEVSVDLSTPLDFSRPRVLGGPGRAGTTTPEHLFATGYAACFASSLDYVAQQYRKDVTGASVTADVTIGTRADGSYGLFITMNAHVPSLARAEAEILVEEAHAVCTYSMAVRGNVPVDLVVTV